MVRLTLRSKVLVIMAIPVAVLVAATFALLAASRDSADALIAERQAASLRGAYEDVLVDMTDAESATRGYVLTGERSFLEPYDLAVERLPALVVPVRSLRSGRVYYRLQMGTTSQAHSAVLCQRMRMNGQSCVVIGE